MAISMHMSTQGAWQGSRMQLQRSDMQDHGEFYESNILLGNSKQRSQRHLGDLRSWCRALFVLASRRTGAQPNTSTSHLHSNLSGNQSVVQG
jgi:hypothetical protein